MMSVLAQASLLCGFSWLLWKTFRQLFRKSGLENIPGPSPSSFLTGSMADIFNVNGWAYHKELAAKYGGLFKFKGFLGETQLYVYDPKAMHTIFVKEQHIFEESRVFLAANNVFFGPGLIGTLGDQHRKQRKMLNPVFSIAHMRNMVPTFYGIVNKLRDAIEARTKDGPREIELVSWMTRTALELIGQSGLGYSFDPLTDDHSSHPYSLAAKKLVPNVFKLNLAMSWLLPTAVKIGTAKFQRFVVDMLPWEDLHEARDIVDVLYTTSREIYDSKLKALADGDEALASQIGNGKDIMSILMRANMTASKEESLSEDELIGQMSTLIFAGMDTTSGALSRILYLLATNSDAQERLRREIQEAKEQNGGEDLPYDELVALPYLDAICRETLRIYPPLTTVRRTTCQDVMLPLSAPIKGLDGREIYEVAVPKNTEVVVGVLESNINPEIWGPDADEWKPDRWLNPLPDTVAGAHLPGIYSHLLTFIGGSRACIGFKFSQLEMKVVLSMLIESFKFSLDKEIVWQMTGISTPWVKGSEGVHVPTLPLVVERINA